MIIIFYSPGQEDDPSWYSRASNSISEISESAVDTQVNVSPLRIIGWSLFHFFHAAYFIFKQWIISRCFWWHWYFWLVNIISRYTFELMSLLMVPKDLLFNLVCAWPMLHNVNYLCGIHTRYQRHMTYETPFTTLVVIYLRFLNSSFA